MRDGVFVDHTNGGMNLIHPYVSPQASLEFFEAPYRHFIVRNLFREDIYTRMCEQFHKYIDRVSTAHGAVGETGQFYDARIYTMGQGDCAVGSGYDFFVWLGWKNFVSQIFSLELNGHTAYTLHFHAGSKVSPSKSGWPHLDLSVCSAIPTSLPIKTTGECNYADDTYSEQPHAEKMLRSVALLYYFNNPDGLSDADGGGTSVYGNYDSSSVIKTIAPKNNSLFAFEVGTASYHGFVGANYNRSAMVQWFHSSPSYIVHRRLPEFKARWKSHGDLFERWKKCDPWHIDRDPSYSRYFDRPLSEVLA